MESFRDLFYKLDEVKDYIKHGFDINAVDKNGFTLLIYAAHNNLPKVVAFLLKQPTIDVNYRDEHHLRSALLHVVENLLYRDDNGIITNLLLFHKNIDLYIKDKKDKNFFDYYLQNCEIFYRYSLNNYTLQKAIIENNPNNIFLFEKYGVLNPSIKEEYPDVFRAKEWGLI